MSNAKSNFFRQKASIMLVCIVVISLLSGCKKQNAASSDSSSEPVIVDYPFNLRGVKIEKAPEKIAVFSAVIAETLGDLGYDSKIVARTDDCNFPETLSTVQSVGTSVDPSIFTLIDLKADIIIAFEGLSEETLGKIEISGIPLLLLAPPSSVNQLFRNYRRIEQLFKGQTTGKESAKKHEEILQGKMDEIQSTLKNQQYGAIYIPNDYGYVATGDTFIGDVMEHVTIKNVSKGAVDWVDDELLNKKDEIDVIFCSNLIADKIKTDARFAETPAVLNGQVFGADEVLLERQTYRFFDEFLAVVSKIGISETVA